MWNRLSLVTAGLLLATGGAGALAQHHGYGSAGMAQHHGLAGGAGPYFGFGVGYPLLCPYLYGWPVAPWYGGYALPPVVVPANAWFGPQALAQFYGWPNTGTAPPPSVPDIVPRVMRTNAELPDVEDGEKPAGLKVRVANAEATARARQFIEYGDARFRQQEFSEAQQRYRKASEAAPNLAEAYFREALAQIALGRYAPAMKSVRRGMALDPDWPTSRFRVDQIYGENRAAKQMHLEQLATAAEKHPENADLIFLLAVELFFDEQPSRAKTFFKRAGQLGTEDHLVRAFLDAIPRERPPAGEDL
ncbi:MAG TPA: tetratricopeptide repeat protein [Pirellulales bacterium]|nr:tetratricopeptide repeat protein [Pirellulales bacterium]